MKNKIFDDSLSRDEMNLAVLPIALLGGNDSRTFIEYTGTSFEDGKRVEWIWRVDGGSLGLPGVLGERVMVALLHLGSCSNFLDRKLEFSIYELSKIIGISSSGEDYSLLKRAIRQLAGVLISSNRAWIEKGKNSKQRISIDEGSHLISKYRLYRKEEGVEDKKSYIIWGDILWDSITSGYLKPLDTDLYFSIEQPLAQRLFRFLDKITFYAPRKPYEIDVFALSARLGMAKYEHASHLKRPLAKAADTLVSLKWLHSYEFIKVSGFQRIRFHRVEPLRLEQIALLPNEPERSFLPDSGASEDVAARAADPIALEFSRIVWYDPQMARIMKHCKFVSFANGILIIDVGDRLQRATRSHDTILRFIRSSMPQVERIIFVSE